MRWLNTALIVAPLALTLAACGSSEGESADEFAGQFKPSGQDNEALARLPKAAPDGKKAIRYSAPYAGWGEDGAKSNLQVLSDGTYKLNENGKIIQGTYEWLPDGRRLRLNGVGFRPILLIAQNGALYRMTNENVPIDDITPDRLYSSQPQQSQQP